MRRRNLLASLGTVGVVAIAGCSGGGSNNGSTEADSQNSGSEDSDGETDSNKSSGNTSSDGSNTDNNSSETEESITSHTSTSVVRQFWEAIIEGNYENANELLHPGSLNYPLDESTVSISGQAVEIVEEVTYDEASDIIALAPKEDLSEAIEDATGATEYTLVHISLTDDDGITPVVKQDDEFLVVWLR